MNEEEKLIAASLFSGIGAPEVAMPHWDWRWHAEIEAFPNAVMKERHPHSINLGDVNGRHFTERALERGRPDVIVFGSPCQSFSVAGRRFGLDDARGNLALIALGIIARLEPSWFVFENVPGLLSSTEGRDFGIFLRAVDECGYSGSWAMLDAQYFGVAQRRRRLFFVGHIGDWRRSAAILFEPESMCGNSPPRCKEGERVTGTVEARSDAGGAGWGTDFLASGAMAISGAVSNKWHKRTGGPAGDECYNLVMADPISANEGRTYTHEGRNNFRTHNVVAADLRNSKVDSVSMALQSGGQGGERGRCINAIPHVVAFDTTQITSKNNRCQPASGDPCHPLAAKAHVPTIAFSCKDHGADAGTIAPTLRAMGQNAVFKPSHYTRDKDGAPNMIAPPLGTEDDKGDQEAVLFTGSSVRRLTPRECERLQGFEDDYTLVQYRGKPAADGPRYKALGNSMAVPCVRWILRRIEMLETL